MTKNSTVKKDCLMGAIFISRITRNCKKRRRIAQFKAVATVTCAFARAFC